MRLFLTHFTASGDISIDDEGLVSVAGNVSLLQNSKVKRLPVSFKKVDGDFWCNNNQLTTLEGTPNSVGRRFFCWNNPLTTLEGMPTQLLSLRLSYSPTLPLLRSLYAKKIDFWPELDDKTLEKILNTYAGQGEAGAFACGAELATAGFKENARW